VRNVLYAIGNSGDPALIDSAKDRLADASPLVRGAAVWALSRLMEVDGFAAMRSQHEPVESDPDVKSEWQS
jgi:epoxyqueuosine reductase